MCSNAFVAASVSGDRTKNVASPYLSGKVTTTATEASS